MIATPETNTDRFRDTIIAYRAVRQLGEKDLTAYYSAREAYRRHQPNDPVRRATSQRSSLQPLRRTLSGYGKALEAVNKS